MIFRGVTAVCIKMDCRFVGLKGNKILPVQFCYLPCWNLDSKK